MCLLIVCRPSLQELQLLTASIRLPALGPCYLSYVCLQQDWFSAAVDTASLARAAAFAAAGPEVRKDLMDYTATSTAAAMQVCLCCCCSLQLCALAPCIDLDLACRLQEQRQGPHELRGCIVQCGWG